MSVSEGVEMNNKEQHGQEVLEGRRRQFNVNAFINIFLYNFGDTYQT